MLYIYIYRRGVAGPRLGRPGRRRRSRVGDGRHGPPVATRRPGAADGDRRPGAAYATAGRDRPPCAKDAAAGALRRGAAHADAGHAAAACAAGGVQGICGLRGGCVPKSWRGSGVYFTFCFI